MVVTWSCFATRASSECVVGRGECEISGIAAGTELGPRLGFGDSFVRTTRADGEAVEGCRLLVAGWRLVCESRVGDLIIIFSNSINRAGRPLNQDRKSVV